jgi:hypothetical protein
LCTRQKACAPYYCNTSNADSCSAAYLQPCPSSPLPPTPAPSSWGKCTYTNVTQPPCRAALLPCCPLGRLSQCIPADLGVVSVAADIRAKCSYRAHIRKKYIHHTT